MSIQHVLNQLEIEGYLKPDSKSKALEQIAISSSETPWYIHLFVAIGAWLAAIFIVALLIVASAITSDVSAIFGGYLLLGIALFLKYNNPRGTFSGQLSLAFTAAGQVFLIGGFAFLFDLGFFATTWLIILIQVGIIIVYPNSIQRFASTLIIVGALTFWLAKIEFWFGLSVLVMLTAILTILYWSNEFKIRQNRMWSNYLTPIAYALPFSMMGVIIFKMMVEGGYLYQPTFLAQPYILTLGLLFILIRLEQIIISSYRVRLDSPIVIHVLFGTAIITLPSLLTPGIIAAMIVLVLGVWRENRVLMGISAVCLIVFLGEFYLYELEMGLITKSYILMATGLTCLAVRFFYFIPQMKNYRANRM